MKHSLRTMMEIYSTFSSKGNLIPIIRNLRFAYVLHPMRVIKGYET